MGRYRVVITESEYEDFAAEREVLEPLDCELVKLNSREEAVLVEALRDADAVLFQWAKLTAPVIEAMEHCRVIAKYATGTDGVDLAAATRKGICVTNVMDYCTEEVSDHACALLLALSRGLKLHDEAIRRGLWDYHAASVLPDLRRGVLGVVGFGRISRRVMEKMRPFCGKIWVASGASAEEIAAAGGQKKTFDQVVEGADYLSIHVPATPENIGRFDRTVFCRMKPTACLVNVARGAVICEADLIAALQAGELAFAALDVFAQEPLPQGSPLRAMNQVLLSPHAAWYSAASQRALQRTAAEQIRAVLEDRCPPCLVNRELAERFSAKS